MQDEVNRLSNLLYGYSGVGKSPLSETAPGPRLRFDVENTSRWLRSRKVYWDGRSNPLELDVDENTTVVLRVEQFKDLTMPMQFLRSGRHPFHSVILDSLTELQLKILNQEAGLDKREYDHWGKLLIWCEKLVIDLKDLTEHPTNPVDCIVVICQADMRDNRIVPLLDGSFKKKVAAKFDLVSYMYREEDASGDDFAIMRIKPTPTIDAKDRTMILAPYYGRTIERPDYMEIMRILNTAPKMEEANG